MEYFCEYILKPIAIGIFFVLCLAGFMLFFHINDFAQKIEYYENDIKFDAIEYHNEIYLKKGE